MAEVLLENLRKRYPQGIEAVRDLSLRVRDKELLVLVGPSGCGKSTVLRLIAGLEEPTEGTIRIDGRVMNEVSPADRNIAMVFQSYALYPHMTVYDNMAFGLRLRKIPRETIDRRVREAARILGLSELLSRRPRALSGGQRQRVALGRAIVRDPAVFLLDEPLSNLDAKLRVAMRREIHRLHRRLQATIVYVTHDQVEAMTLGDRICVMNDGRLQQVGPPLEVYERPANRFVAGFIGSPAMNFLPGRLVPDGERLAFDDGFRRIGLPPGMRLLPGVRGGHGEVILGVRPEHITPRRSAPADSRGGAGEGRWEGTVEVREPLGHETVLHVAVEGHLLTCKAEAGFEVEVGDRVVLTADLGRACLFDGGDGRSLLEP